MVGGGRGAFIGAVHRIAANIDGQIELVAGAFSSDPEKSKASGADFFLSPDRVYGSYQELVTREAALPADQRIDFVSIVTRNNTHAPIARAFMEAGFHVVCDKPLCFSFKEGLRLREVVRRTGKVFALTHNYTGYPMVKEAREWVRTGRLGRPAGEGVLHHGQLRPVLDQRSIEVGAEELDSRHSPGGAVSFGNGLRRTRSRPRRFRAGP